MQNKMINRLGVVPSLGLMLVLGCEVNMQPDGDNGMPDNGDTPVASADALADVATPDVNPASARFQQSVSPRDYLGEVTAWYFGHST